MFKIIACDCDREGTLDYNCHKETGQCVCRAGYTGVRCDMCADGYYGERMCTLCNCDVGTVREVCDKLDGTCLCAPNYAGERCNECAPGFYNFPSCLRTWISISIRFWIDFSFILTTWLACECDEEGSRGPSCTFYGNQQQCACKEGRSGPKCDQCAPGYYKYVDISSFKHQSIPFEFMIIRFLKLDKQYSHLIVLQYSINLINN